MAAIVLRDAENDDEVDWATIGQVVAETHVPESGRCRECGEEWNTFCDFPGCTAFSEARAQLGAIIAQRAHRIVLKHRNGAA